MVHQLVYYSKSTCAGGDHALLVQLRDIVSAARRNNARAGITGFLIFDKTWFVQVLEGDRANVSEIYNKIMRDGRHSGLNIINVRDVEERSFPNWTMGSAVRSPEVQGVYLQHGISGQLDPIRLKSSQVIELALALQAFEEGRRLPAAS
jgi:Sensors of blue-light using FAD